MWINGKCRTLPNIVKAILGVNVLLAVLLTDLAFGQSQDPRQQMITNYLDYQRHQKMLYDSPPVTHLVPNFNTISYALLLGSENSLLIPTDNAGNPLKQTNINSDLTLKGYTVAPHIAMSLKKVGLGFSAEKGERRAFFRSISNNSTLNSFQESSVDYSAVGFNVSILPYQIQDDFLKVAVIVGWKTFFVSHKWSQLVNMNSDVSELSNSQKGMLRYSVDRYQVGLNLNFALMKSFRFIPWADYMATDSKDALSSYDNAQRGRAVDKIYENDVKMFWNDIPDFRYGIDFAIHIVSFEIRFGSALGTFARLNSAPESINDKTYTVSFSWDHKGS